MNRTLTAIVHGTFAAEAKWWRLGTEGKKTFADRLETELAQRGLAGTVWQVALDNGLNYHSFTWSGRNRHRDRLQGAKKLSSSLNELAQKIGATPHEPLTLNLIAHSHGGNVALEALRHLKSNIKLGRMVLLGTPLITVKPAFRLARFLFSIYLFVAFTIITAVMILILVNSLFQTQFVDTKAFGSFADLAIFFPGLILTGWLWWGFGNLMDYGWKVLLRFMQPLFWLRKKSDSHVYGPAPKNLMKMLAGRQIYMLTSYNDEADLLLQISSTPAKFYTEYVKEYFSKIKKLLHNIFFRPLFLSVFLKAIETLLDSISLGFSLWRTLLFDFKVVPVEHPYYPSHILKYEKIDVNSSANASFTTIDDVIENQRPKSFAKIIESRQLLSSLKDVISEIKLQIQLRHSSYYEDQNVISRLAELLTNDDDQMTQQCELPKSLKPSEKFWEKLFVGNVALGLLYAWITGGIAEGGVVTFFGYAFSLLVLGVILLLSRQLKKLCPKKVWRWFWVLWTVFAIFIFIVALSERMNP